MYIERLMQLNVAINAILELPFAAEPDVTKLDSTELNMISQRQKSLAKDWDILVKEFSLTHKAAINAQRIRNTRG